MSVEISAIKIEPHTFTLKGDAKYANSASQDTFRFIRERGEIELVDYTRDPKR